MACDDESAAYQKVVDSIRDDCADTLTEAQAHEAARVLIEFAKTALAICRRPGENKE